MTVDIETIGVEFQTTGLEKGTRAFRENEAAAFRAADAADKTTSKFTAMDRAAMEAGRQLSTLNSALGGLGAVAGTIGILGGIRELTKLSDEYSKFTAQLKLASTSQAEFAASYQAVVSISKTAQSDLAATGVLYARIANGTRELGISQQQVAKITETVSLALKVSGATASESASAMLQLSQAFASGVLRGEEFNAVNEAAPRLMKALADGIGVPVGALRHMAEQGQLTSSILAESLPKALEGLRTEATSVQTISGAYTLLKNNVLQFVGVQAQANGSAAALSSAIALLANNLELVAAAGTGFTTVKIADALVGITTRSTAAVASSMEYSAALQAQRVSAIESAQAEAARVVALQASLVASQSALVISREESIAKLASANASVLSSQAQITAARSAGALSAALALVREGEIALTAAMSARSVATAELAALGQQQARISAQITAANAAQTASEAALTVAKAGGSAAAGLATRAMGLLGGPIGIITTLLGVGVTAWMAWGSAAKHVSEEAKKSVLENGQELIDQVTREVDALRQRNDLLAKGYVAPQTGAEDKQKRLNDLYLEYNRLVTATGGSEAEQIVRREKLRFTTEQIGKATTALNAQEVENARNAMLSGANQEALNNIRLKAAGINTQTIKDTAEIARLRVAGLIGEKEYLSLLKLQQDAVLNKSKADKDAASVAKRAAEQLDQLNVRIGERIDLANQELLAGRQLTEAEKEEVKVSELLGSSRIKLSAAQKALVSATLEHLKVAEMAVLVQRSEFALAMELAKLRQTEKNTDYSQTTAALNDISAAYSASLKAVNERIQGLKDEEAAVNLAASKNISLAEAIERVAIARLRERQDKFFAGSEGYEAIQREIDAREKLVTMVATKDMRDQFTSLFTDINRGLTDSLYRSFEAGKRFFDALWSGIKNTFKTTVLKLAVQGVVGSVLGVGGSVAQAAGGASTLGNLGNLASIGSALGSLGGMAGFVGGTSGAVAAGNVAGALGGDAIGTLINGLGGAEAAVTTFGSTVAAAIPYVAAALAAYKLADSLFGSKGGPKTESGYGLGYGDKGLDPKAAQQVSTAITDAYKQLAQTLGLAVKDLQVGVFTSIDTIGKALTQLDVTGTFDGKAIASRGSIYGTTENVGRSPEELQAAITAETNRVLLFALQNSDLPAKFKDYLATATDLSAAVTTLASVKKLDEALGLLGGGFEKIAQLSVGAEAALVQQFGGLDSLAQQLSSYYQNFYTQGERTQRLTASLAGSMAQLGLALPTTREGFRALVEGALSSGNNGLAAKLLQLSDAFASVTPEAQGAALSVADAAKAFADAATRLETAKKSVVDSLAALQDYGNGIQASITSTMSAINDLRGQALATVTQAAQESQAALKALKDYSDSLASQIAQNNASINQLRGQAGQNVLTAQNALQSALQSLSSRADQDARSLKDAATAVASAQQELAQAQAQITQTYLQAVSDRDAVRNEIASQLQQATNEYEAAQKRVIDLQKQGRDSLRQFGNDLQAYVRSLETGKGANSPLTNPQAAQRQFDELAARAQAGDADARSKLTGAADTLLSSIREFGTSAEQLTAADIQIRTVLGGLAKDSLAAAGPAADPAAEANTAVSEALANLQRIQAIAQAAGVDAVASSRDLLAEYQAAAAKLNSATADVLASGASFSEKQVGTLDAYIAATEKLTEAQAAQEAMAGTAAASADAFASAAQQAAASGISLSNSQNELVGLVQQFAAASEALTQARQVAMQVEADKFQADQGLLAQYVTLTGAVATLASQQQALVQGANALGADLSAVNLNVDTVAGLFDRLGVSQTNLSQAQDVAAQVQAELYTQGADLVGKYQTLIGQLGEYSSQLSAYQLQIAAVDFGPLNSQLSQLDKLMAAYIASVQELTGATAAQQSAQTALATAQENEQKSLGDALARQYAAGNNAAANQAYIQGGLALNVTGSTTSNDVSELYRTILGRRADSADASQALANYINAGQLTLESLAASIRSSLEYQARSSSVTAQTSFISTVNSLLGTGMSPADLQALMNVPQFAVGTNYVPQDMLAMIHAGEAIVPKAFNPEAGGFDLSELLAELRELRKEVAQLRADNSVENQAIAANTREVATFSKRVMAPEGDAIAIRNNRDTAPIKVYS